MQQAAFIPLVAIVGPTASGKTSLGVAIAKRYNGEVVSADSMQIYTGMQIATAKPDAIQRQGILHHMMDFLDPQETYSVAQYAQRARNVICDIYKRGKLPVLTADFLLQGAIVVYSIFMLVSGTYNPFMYFQF